jgi:hypothetical protein
VVRKDGILFGLDNQPAVVIQCGKFGEHARKIDAAVTRHGKHTVENGVEKARVAGADPCQNLAPDILAMDMPDAIPVPPNECGWIDTGIDSMSGIQKQADFVAGHCHQAIDFGPALDHGPHMVMVDEPDAGRGQVLGKLGQPSAQIVPVAGGEPRPARQRPAPITGDAAARFGIDPVRRNPSR